MTAYPYTWDHDDAVAFIVARTFLDADLTSRVLLAQHRFELGMGIAPASDDAEAADVEAMRAAYPLIFRPENIARRLVSYEAELAFVTIDSDVDALVGAKVVAGELAYKASRGIVDPETVDSYERWVAARADRRVS